MSTPEFAATYLIPHENVERLTERFADLNQRIRSKGLETGMITAYPVGRTLYLPTGEKNTLERFEWVTVMGDTPRFNGWKFQASYHHDGDGAPALARNLPGVEIPKRFWVVEDNSCDYCGRSIRRRKTYLVRHESGEFKIVGSNCLRDFLGHVNPQGIAETFFYLPQEIEAFREPRGGMETRYFDQREDLAWTAGIVRNFGWTSVSKTRLDPTAHATIDALAFVTGKAPHGQAYVHWKETRAKCAPTDADYAVADQVFRMIREADGDSAYLFKLKTLEADASGVTTWTNRPLWISAITLYLREQKRTAKSAPPVQAGRQVVSGTIQKREERVGNYGIQLKIMVEDGEGRKFWGTLPRFAIRLDVGDKIKFAATVKPSDRNQSFGFYTRPTKAPKVRKTRRKRAAA